MNMPDATLPEAICARARCRALARWRVEWRNPRIHTADRRKVWLACEEHVEFLRDYLATRDFPVEVHPFVAADAPHQVGTK